MVLAMGLGRGSIGNRPTVRLSRGANCIWRCSLCPRCQHSMTAVVLSCNRAPLVSAHCSLSPDDVLGVLGCVQLSVLTGCRLVHQLHVCLWQWSTQSLVHVPKWGEAELTLPRFSPVSAVNTFCLPTCRGGGCPMPLTAATSLHVVTHSITSVHIDYSCMCV